MHTCIHIYTPFIYLARKNQNTQKYKYIHKYIIYIYIAHTQQRNNKTDTSSLQNIEYKLLYSHAQHAQVQKKAHTCAYIKKNAITKAAKYTCICIYMLHHFSSETLRKISSVLLFLQWYFYTYTVHIYIFMYIFMYIYRHTHGTEWTITLNLHMYMLLSYICMYNPKPRTRMHTIYI